MYPTLDLELVHTFLTVVETQSFKEAARHLNKTPAAVSQQIKRLEEQLGSRLLDRNNQGLRLTATGKYVKERGDAFLSLNHQFFSELKEDDLAGPIHIGTPSDTAPTFLKKLLPIFQREFPSVTPIISLEPSRKLKMRIQSGNLDMAILADDPGQSNAIPLWQDPHAWYGKAINTKMPLPVGVLSIDTHLRDDAFADLEHLNQPYQVCFEASTVFALREAVATGFCHALLPRSMADGLAHSHNIKASKPHGVVFYLKVGPRLDRHHAKILSEKFKWVLGQTL